MLELTDTLKVARRAVLQYKARKVVMDKDAERYLLVQRLGGV